MANKMINLELLKEPRFLLIGFSTFFGMLGFYVPYVYLINMATISKGVKEEDASFLISIIGTYKMLSIPRALCVKSWLKKNLKIGKIPIFTRLEGSEVVKSKKQKCQAPQNTY